jgi:hypothetical protein
MSPLYRCHDPNCFEFHRIIEDRKFCRRAKPEPKEKPGYSAGGIVRQTPIDVDTIEITDGSGRLLGRFSMDGMRIDAETITSNKISMDSITFRAEQRMNILQAVKDQVVKDFVTWPRD